MHNTLLNSANISVVVTDQNGVIQFFNAGAERILGYIASDVINKTTVMDLCDFAEATSARAVSPEREGRAHLPGVIGMDVNLPDISGYEALEIRQDPATMSIPVISLSANAMPSAIQRGIAAGFFRYITKPLRINEFMTALAEALTVSVRDKKIEKLMASDHHIPESVNCTVRHLQSLQQSRPD